MSRDPNALRSSAMMLLPGLMCDHAFWQPLMDSKPVLPCQVVDYGDADTLTAMAEAALAAAPPSFALAGHSMGGRVALEIVRIAPSRVRQLILMNTGYLPRLPGEKGETEKAGRMALIDIATQQGVRAMCAQWVQGMLHPDRLADSALIDEIIEMFARKTAGRFARQQNALLTRPDASPVLSGLNIPCLMLCGEQDNWATVEQHEAMRALAPHASLAVIEDAGHMVLMERPEPTISAVNQFLKSSMESPC